MAKNWAETMENLSYCNLYKNIGVYSCRTCQNINCKHNENPNKSKKNSRKKD